jgi:hypothetical protein
MLGNVARLAPVGNSRASLRAPGPDLPFDRVANFRAPLFENGALPAFDEQTGFRFGTGVTQQQAAALCLHFRPGLGHQLGKAVQLGERQLLAHDDVRDDLRETRPALREGAQGPATRAHGTQNLERRHEAVAGRAMIAENQMTALLAAEAEAGAEHFINDILVAHVGADDLAAGGSERGVQTAVAHHGGNERLPGERPAPEHVECGDGHHIVAINQRARLVAQQHAVGVAVVRDAHMRPVRDDLAAHEFRVHRAAILVDVFSVRLIAKDKNLGAELAQDAGRGFVGGAVRAIRHDAQPLERQTARRARLGKLDVAAQRVVNAHGLADLLGRRADMLDPPLKTKSSISASILSSSL